VKLIEFIGIVKFKIYLKINIYTLFNYLIINNNLNDTTFFIDMEIKFVSFIYYYIKQ
jgi:hypothetical protein